MSDGDSFPRRSARTQRFTLGAPRSFSISRNGAQVLFVRSHGPEDPVGCLVAYDVSTATERVIVDPAALLGGDEGPLPPEERARRERLREGAGGIVAYAVDESGERACFALGGRLFVVDIGTAAVRELATVGPVIDPRLDPTGSRVAYVAHGALHVTHLDGTMATLADDPDPDVTWGAAEFIASEEMGRLRGFWWSPDGSRLLAERVDVSPVTTWHLADLSDPGREATAIRYPVAGSENADVALGVITLDGACTDVEWDRDRLPYLVTARWDEHGALIAVQSRDQQHIEVLTVDPDSGATHLLLASETAPWATITPGVPDRLDDGRLVTVVDEPAARRVAVDGVAVSPADLHVTAVLDVAEDVLVVATREQTERHVWRIAPDGSAEPLTTESGVHTAVRRATTMVTLSASMDRDGTHATVSVAGEQRGEIASVAAAPELVPSVTFLSSTQQALRLAVLLPRGHVRGSPLPVLMDPYGGPGHGRVVRSRAGHLTSQWLADQGFAVVVADGRGTPGRSPEFEHAIAVDWSEKVLADQIEALHHAAEANSDLDLTRVGIRGWSFGGYLAALAVLRAPDTFHAAVAGAPVTDWRLYDTHYNERYLGLPQENPKAYAAMSLVDDAPNLRRPLLLIHGIADDNVVVAHTLLLSGALLAAGRPHTVLPVSGVTHMTPQPVVAENLLNLQVEFLREALGATEAYSFGGN